MKKIAIYCRVSTDEQAKNKEGSITSQIQRLKLKVQGKNGLGEKWGKVIRIYKDEAFSGKNTDRPEFQQMMRDIRLKRINTVMVTELSRLSRSVTDFLTFIKELEAHDCDFVCPQYDFDTTSPAGKVFVTIIMALAQFERELTAERIKNNFHARALRGLSNGGHPFLGYDKDLEQSGNLLVNKTEAELVRKIFEMYLAASGVAEVSNTLNSKGIRNKGWTGKDGKPHGNKKFNIDAVLRILSHLAYVGKREVNKTNKNQEQSSLKPEERYEVVKATWEPILDEKLFDKVQEKLSKNKKLKYNTTYDFIFSGLLICDECGLHLTGGSATGRNKKHFYYTHAKKSSCKIQRYDAQELETKIKKELFSVLQNKNLKKEFIEAVSNSIQDRPKLAKALLKEKEQEINELEEKIDRLTDLIANEKQSAGSKILMSKLEEYGPQLEKLKLERMSLKDDALMELKNTASDPEVVLSRIDSVRKDNFRKASLSRKRGMLREAIKSIHVHPKNTIKIDLWSSEFAANEAKKQEHHEKDLVIPFRKLGRPLETSFRKYASKGDGMEQARKAVGMGTYVLDYSNVIFWDNEVADSCRLGNGRSDWI